MFTSKLIFTCKIALLVGTSVVAGAGCNQKPPYPGGGSDHTGDSLAVSGLAPTSGPAGMAVTVRGSGFSSTASENTVTFGGAGATVSAASDTVLGAVVPNGLSAGTKASVQVTVDNQTAPGPDFTVTGGGLASGYPGDEGIEADPAVIFASRFNGGPGEWTRYDESVSQIRTNSSFAHSGAKYLQITATRGKDTGGQDNYEFNGVDSVYLRFYVKFDKHTMLPHHFVKIRAYKNEFPYGHAGQKPEGDNAFWTGIEPRSSRTWHFYTYWYKMHSWQTPEGDPDGKPNPYYGNTFWPRDQKPFERGEWICVEAYVKANTPGQSDGEMAFWINGRKIGEWKPGTPVGTWEHDKFVTGGPYNDNPHPFEGFDFRSDPIVKIKEIALEWYLSDYSDATQDKNKVYFDDVVVATKYIGPQVKSE